MKKILTYFVVGCLIAVIGIIFSAFCGDFLTGMDYGSACTLGIGIYLCVLIVTCTGIIVSKISSISSKPNYDDSSSKDNK